MAVTNNTAQPLPPVVPKTPTLPPAPPQTGGFDPKRVYPGGFGGAAVNAQPSSGPVTAPTSGPVTPQAFTPFSPTNNLIGTQINPSSSTRALQAGNMAQNAAGNVSSYQFQPFTPMSPVNTSGSSAALTQAQQQMNGLTMPTYNPVAGTDLSGANQTLGQAGNYAIPDQQLKSLAGAGGVGSFDFAGDTGGVRSSAVGQLNQLLNTTPDRAKLAADSYQLLQDQYEPQYQQNLRQVGQKAAALGRVGSGLTTNDLTGVQQSKDNYFSQQGRALATDAAQRSLEDQQAKLAAAQGLTSTLGGLDLSAGGLNQGYNALALQERGNSFNRLSGLNDAAFNNLLNLSGQQANYAGIGRNDALTERSAQREAQDAANQVGSAQAGFNRGISSDLYGRESDAYSRAANERDAALQYDQARFGNEQSRLGSLSAYENSILGNEAANRNEIRGERAYQYGAEQDAQAARERQWQNEQQANNTAFNQALQLAQFGYGTNPAGAVNAAGQQQGQQAGQLLDTTGPLFLEWARRNRQAPPGQPAPRPSYVDPAGPV